MSFIAVIASPFLREREREREKKVREMNREKERKREREREMLKRMFEWRERKREK